MSAEDHPDRLVPGVVFRREPFGSLVYVPRRDHFFALDAEHTRLIGAPTGQAVAAGDERRLRLLQEIGVCRSPDGAAQRAFFGRSVVGRIDQPVAPTLPMVVNCFATAGCPLACRYCHADDLMVGYRDRERPGWLRRVISAALATPAMATVVTGGEPLAQPRRAEALIMALRAHGRAVVLDTSGVGDLAQLLPALREHQVHVRVSLDSADATVNDRLRPVRGGHARGASSWAAARDTIRQLVDAGVPCSVQTVVTAKNADLTSLLALRDHVVGLGVTTWVLHTMVPVGRGAATAARRLLAPPEATGALRDLVGRSAADGVPLDVRVTGTHRAPNAVLLVNASGELCTEQTGPAGGKLVQSRIPGLAGRRSVRFFQRHVNLVEHANRYLNGTLHPFAQPVGSPLPARGDASPVPAGEPVPVGA